MRSIRFHPTRFSLHWQWLMIQKRIAITLPQHLKRLICLSDAHYDRYDRRKCNFYYRKLFTPDLNVFPYTKVIYLSVISVIYRKTGIHKNAIYTL